MIYTIVYIIYGKKLVRREMGDVKKKIKKWENKNMWFF